MNEMHISGILVRTRPEHVASCTRAIESIPGVEVHHTDPATGRLVAVLESATFDGQQRLLQRVRAAHHVLLADLVVYRREPSSAVECRTEGAPR
jgi:nitrate reductase NapD